jgi:hypothetical protein
MIGTTAIKLNKLLGAFTLSKLSAAEFSTAFHAQLKELGDQVDGTIQVLPVQASTTTATSLSSI